METPIYIIRSLASCDTASNPEGFPIWRPAALLRAGPATQELQAHFGESYVASTLADLMLAGVGCLSSQSRHASMWGESELSLVCQVHAALKNEQHGKTSVFLLKGRIPQRQPPKRLGRNILRRAPFCWVHHFGTCGGAQIREA